MGANLKHIREKVFILVLHLYLAFPPYEMFLRKSRNFLSFEATFPPLAIAWLRREKALFGSVVFLTDRFFGCVGAP